jgi:glycosyltransferase involved in cell wall biosynthesis
MQKNLIIIPTYNNPQTIKVVTLDVLAHGYEAIVVDDGSDIAVESLFNEDEKEGIYFLRHKQNSGKGAAIITGMTKVKELGRSFAGSIDGDGQHLACEMQKLLDVYKEGEILIGARNFDLEHVPNGSKFGRWFSNFWACWDTGYEITDSLSGYRIYPISILDLDIKTQRFDWEMEVLVRHADADGAISEVLIECYYPTPEERVSHFKKWEDTAAIVWVHIQILPFKWPKMLLNKILGK